MFEKDLITAAEVPEAIYTSNTIFHTSMIKHLKYQLRASDKKEILLSSDVRGDIVISEWIPKSDSNNFPRLEKNHKFINCHYNPIKKLEFVSKSNFFWSFSQGESLKIWNSRDGFMTIAINEGRSHLDTNAETILGHKEIIIANCNAEIEFYGLEFTNYTKNLAVSRLGVKEKVIKMKNMAFFDMISYNHPEIPYIGVIAHDFSTLVFKLLSDKTLETLKVFKLQYSSLKLERSLVNCYLKLYQMKDGDLLVKYNEEAFLDNLKVFIY